MNNLPAYRKTIAAIVGVLITWASVVIVSPSAAITAAEWLSLAGGLGTVLGVYQTPNEPQEK